MSTRPRFGSIMRFRFRLKDRRLLKREASARAQRLYGELMKAGAGPGAQRLSADLRRWKGCVEPLYRSPSERPASCQALGRFLELGPQRLQVMEGLYAVQAAAASVAFEVTVGLRWPGRLSQQERKALGERLVGELPLGAALERLESPTPALHLHEKLQTAVRRHWPADLLGTLFHDSLPKKLRHAFGAYHTAAIVARELTRCALKEWRVTCACRGADLPRPLRVLDPGCGSGVFLVEAHREESELEVWGYDLSPTAVFLARLNLLAVYPEPQRDVVERITRQVGLNDTILGRPFEGGGGGASPFSWETPLG